MAVLEIAKLGNPVLREKALPVKREEIKSDEIQTLIDDMVETMKKNQGMGLAAPQVSVSKQIVVIELDSEEGQIPMNVLINPKFKFLSKDESEDWEGCLSIDNLRGKVPRSRKVIVTALDGKGKDITIEAEGIFAVVLQHEIDHLDGILYIDRMKDMTTLSQLKELSLYGKDYAGKGKEGF
jgi:peptide deformylase